MLLYVTLKLRGMRGAQAGLLKRSVCRPSTKLSRPFILLLDAIQFRTMSTAVESAVIPTAAAEQQPPVVVAPAPVAVGGGVPVGAMASMSMGGGMNNVGGLGNGNNVGGEGRPNFLSASLYIGDLLPEVNEGLLFEIFNAVGPVASIRVCRDAVTRRSLGYAYVNYHQTADAERALDSMNFTEIKGKPCRIMWSQRDPSVRRSGVGNIFVKNLHDGIDNKQLYDTFGLFGNILSCKVVTDKATGLSKGYGYVHYETDEAAASAIEKLDGMLIDGREVQVGEFMRRDNRPDAQAFTNCFVKNIPYEWDEKKLEDEFMKFGEIVSVSISMGKRKKIIKKKVEVTIKKEGEEEDGVSTEDIKEVEDMKVVEKEKENGGNGENGKEEKKGGGIFGGLFSKKKDVAVSYRHLFCLYVSIILPLHTLIF